MTITGDSADNGSFLMDDSFEYLDFSRLSIISNGLSIEEKTTENPLGVLPYHFELKFDSDSPDNHISWGVNMLTYEVRYILIQFI